MWDFVIGMCDGLKLMSTSPDGHYVYSLYDISV